MPRLPFAATATIGLVLISGCQPAAVEGELRMGCGPLDGSAFVITLPDAQGWIDLYAEGSPESADGSFEIPSSPGSTEVSLCDSSRQECVGANIARFALEGQPDGSFEGSLLASFEGGERREVAFTARPVAGEEPVFCG